MPAPAAVVFGTLGAIALFSSLAGLGKKKKVAAPSPTPFYPVPGAAPGAPVSSGGPQTGPAPLDVQQWTEWVDGKVTAAGQLTDPGKIEQAANEIEGAATMWPEPLKGYAMGAVESLRQMAASRRVDRTRPPVQPPMTSQPLPYSPPPPAAGPIPTQPPISMPPPTDFGQWIQQKVVEGGTTLVPETAEHVATEIEQRIPEMPPDMQARARQAASSLRSYAASLRRKSAPQPPVNVPVAVPPPAPPRVPDPVLDSRGQLALAMTNQLKAGGNPPANRYNASDMAIVKQFQTQEGLTADGLYGVGTGLEVAKYGIVPARPFHFSKDPAKTRAAKETWTTRMLAMAAADPSRAAEWRAASNVANL